MPGSRSWPYRDVGGQEIGFHRRVVADDLDTLLVRLFQRRDRALLALRRDQDRVDLAHNIGIDQFSFFVGFVVAGTFQEFNVRLLRGVAHAEEDHPEELVFLKDDPGELRLTGSCARTLARIRLAARGATAQKQQACRQRQETAHQSCSREHRKAPPSIEMKLAVCLNGRADAIVRRRSGFPA
jgi:hypothetical protein